MLEVTINGSRHRFPEGLSILDAAGSLGIEIPALCHDDRLVPNGACRLCTVEVKGWPVFPSACSTPLASGMEILTHSAEVEEMRRTNLGLLAANYSPDELAGAPDKPFHRWLRDYGLQPSGPTRVRFRDDRHPYLHVDMAHCIHCARCVRICEEVQGQNVWEIWNRGLASSILPRGGQGLLQSGCVSCGACADTCPTGAIEDRSVLQHGSPESWTRTTCPYCGTGCEMLVGLRNSRIVQVKPAADAPVNKGHLCVKGRYAFEFTHSPERVTEPLLREGEQWRVISWPEAVDFITSTLQRILKKHGSQSVAMLGSARGTNEENYVAQKFARLVLGTNNIDCCARVCHAPSAAALNQMLGTGAATNCFDDIEQTAGFLICGCNPTEAHPVIGARIKQAVLRGARLIVIDPRATELARLADVHLPLRPGTNIPLLNALAHVILEETLADDDALRHRVRDLDPFRAFIQNWTPERAEGLCGVPAGLIRNAARLYATAKPSMAFHGLGLTEHVQGTEGVMALVNLALLTGNFGKPGSGVNPLRGQNNVQGSAHMGCEPGHLTGYAPLQKAADFFGGKWGAALPQQPGLNLMEMMDAAAQGELKALWAIGYDVALTNPDIARTHGALAALDLIIVQDLFLNQLAQKFAHLVLPAASPFEKEGTFMNAERRVQRVRRVLPPLGSARPDWEILCAVAKGMGWTKAFSFSSAEAIWNEIRSVWPAGAGISYARLESGGLQWPCPHEDHPGTSILHLETFSHERTAPLQCIEFDDSGTGQSNEFPFLLTTGRTLYQFNAGTMTMRTPNAELRPADTLEMSAADAHRLGLCDGERVCVSSPHGSATISLQVEDRMKPGELFASFHTREAELNRLIGSRRDNRVMTPEYKVMAVRVDKADH